MYRMGSSKVKLALLAMSPSTRQTNAPHLLWVIYGEECQLESVPLELLFTNDGDAIRWVTVGQYSSKQSIFRAMKGRKTGGRRKGVSNRVSAAIVAEARATGLLPHEMSVWLARQALRCPAAARHRSMTARICPAALVSEATIEAVKTTLLVADLN